MNPTSPVLPQELWRSLCDTELVRPALVAAGRARLASNDWPPPLAVADAVLTRHRWGLRHLALTRPPDPS